jgi:hypothetical protein
MIIMIEGVEMNKDKLIELAKEAGFVVDEDSRKHQPNCIVHTHYLIDAELMRFAELVAAAEREACARLIQPFAIGEYPAFSGRDDPVDLALCAAAERIRTVSNGLRKALGGV